LIKQTLQYATSDRPIALNGPLLKLGNINDIKNLFLSASGIRIGWKYDVGLFSTIFPDLAETPDVMRRSYLPYRWDISQIECDTQFDIDPDVPPSELSLLQPSLTSCAISASAIDAEQSHTARLQVHRATTPIGEVNTKRSTSRRGSNERLQYAIDDLDAETKTEVLEDYPSGKIIGAALRHFFPYLIGVQFDDAQRRASQISEYICTQRQSLRTQREYGNIPVPSAVTNIIEEWLTSNSEFFARQGNLPGVPVTASARTVADLVEILQSLRRGFRWTRAGQPASFPSLLELQPRITEALTRSFPSQVNVELEFPRLLSNAATQIQQYFINQVRYLGPLRDEPKPLYPLEALTEPTDVGYRGEHTAFVLHLNQNREVTYVVSVATAAQASDIDGGLDL
jgi:hypothetical protein